MEHLDPKTQERVWQRVRGEEPAAVPALSLMTTEAEVAAQLQLLMRNFPGKRKLLQTMLSQTRNHLTCLQGMCLLRQGKKPPRPAVRPRSTDTTALVRKCYVNCMNLAAKYDAGSADPEYGIVYAEMSHTKRRHCAQLLSLLGDHK